MANSCHQAKGHKPVLRCDFSAVSQTQKITHRLGACGNWLDLRLARKFAVARRHPTQKHQACAPILQSCPFNRFPQNRRPLKNHPRHEQPLERAIFATKRQFQARRQQ
jgi:hypothetical protein